MIPITQPTPVPSHDVYGDTAAIAENMPTSHKRTGLDAQGVSRGGGGGTLSRSNKHGQHRPQYVYLDTPGDRLSLLPRSDGRGIPNL